MMRWENFMHEPAEGHAADRFAPCIQIVLKHEGGFSEHADDPGGATNMGITRKTLARWRRVSPWWTLPVADVRALGEQEARQIYRGLFWEPSGAAKMPPGVDLAFFDFAVNSGPSQAGKTLQGLLGVRRDGRIGPVTLQALEARIAQTGVAGLIDALCDKRLGFLASLATFAVFGRGWRARVRDIRAQALLFAPRAQKPQERDQPMTFLSGYKTYIIAVAMAVAGLAQLLGVDLPALDGQSAGQLMLEAFAVLFLRRGIKNDVANA